MATVAEVIREGQRAIRQLEPRLTAELLDAYERVWQSVEREIRYRDALIQQAVDAGEEVSEAWLRRQAWYRQLQDSIDVEVARFQQHAVSGLVGAQSEAVAVSAATGREFVQALNLSSSFAGRVNPGAMERWVSALQPNSPIRGVLAKYGARAEAALVARLTEGIGSGQGIGTMVRNLRRDIGPDVTAGRLQTIARTETMRAFRGSSRDQFTSMPAGVITGYRWTASLSTRTCVACIALHGTISRTYRMDQHVACRCVQTPIVSDQYAPPRVFGPAGEVWFAEQPLDVQQAILPSARHWEMYREGLPLSEIVGYRRSSKWGTSVRVKSAAELRRAS